MAEIPDWVTDPSKLEEKVLGWVVDWLVSGIWEGVQAVVSWILTLFDEALIRPMTSAGRGVMRAFAPIGDVLIDAVWSVSGPLRQIASSSPFALVMVSFLAGVFLVGFAYVLRTVALTAKTVTWK